MMTDGNAPGDGIEVFEFQKNAAEKVIAKLKEFRGFRLIDLRIYFQGSHNQWIATKRGICLQTSQLSLLRKALEKLEEAVDEHKEAQDQ